MKITSKTSVEELATIVCDALRKNQIEAILVGGAVVTLYSNNEYQSKDLDFITHADRKSIELVMKALGFHRSKGRHFIHPATSLIVEFPSPPLAIGDEPIKKWATKRTKNGVLFLLAPTECVMDRLAAFYHWRDLQALDQALSVASHQSIRLKRIKDWSKREGMLAEFEKFINQLKLTKSKKRK